MDPKILFLMILLKLASSRPDADPGPDPDPLGAYIQQSVHMHVNKPDSNDLDNLNCGETDEGICRPNGCKIWEVNCSVRKCKGSNCHCCKPKVMNTCEAVYGTSELSHLTIEHIGILEGRQINELLIDCIDIWTSSYSNPSPQDIEFRLYTSKNPIAYNRLINNDKNSVDDASLDSSLPMVVIAHGFTENASISLWMHLIKNKLMSKKPINTILVQWAKLADISVPHAIAAKNARFVGMELAKLLNFLQSYTGLSPSNIHIIGFSLGAQLAGVAGYHIDNLARITGLDPSGPLFYDVEPQDRLDSSDADFVDVIHTTAGITGYKYRAGHVDFFMNGGTSQKGCHNSQMSAIICSHYRATEYYIESLDASEPSYGYLCEDYQTFETGHCLNNDHNSVGYDVTPDVKGAFYMDTQAESTYLTRSISLGLTFGLSELQSAGYCQVLVGVLLPGREVETERMSSGWTGIHPGSTLTKLVTVPSTTTLDSIQILVQYKQYTFIPLCPNQLAAKEIEAYDSYENKRYCVTGPIDMHVDVVKNVTLTPGSC